MEWLICKRVHPSRKIVPAFNLGMLKYKDVPMCALMLPSL